MAPALDSWGEYRLPDLIVVIDCDLALVEEQRGYAINRQDKVPDFVLEVASPTTGRADYTEKHADSSDLVWQNTGASARAEGEYHDAALAGDRLVEGEYEPIAVEMLEDGHLRRYSVAPGLYVCWEEGLLRFFDPRTESYLRSHEEDASPAESSESRVTELEEELCRLRGE